MLKRLIVILVFLLSFPTFVSADVDEVLGISTFDEILGVSTSDEFLGVAVASDSCTEAYAPTLTHDSNYYVGRYDNTDFVGAMIDPEQNECVCKVKAYIRAETGDQTGIDYYCRIFTIDGNSDVDTIVGTSSALAGANINGNAGTYAEFTFSPCVNVSHGTTYAYTIFPDQDSDLTDNPDNDTSNYWAWGYDNGSNVDAISLGKGAWTWDDTIPYADDSTDATDDMLIKVWTE